MSAPFASANERKCSIENCGHRHLAKGLCTTHYSRQRRHSSARASIADCQPVGPPAPAAKPPIYYVAQAPATAPKLDASHWLVEGRRQVTSRSSHGSVHLGEPTAGRSALEMRQRAAQLPGEDREDERTITAKGRVTLPRLKFMERGQ